MPAQNFHVVLNKKPGANNPATDDVFRYEECPYPELKDSTVIVRATYLSTDPAMRCRLNDDTGVDYIKAFVVGETIEGFGGLGVVMESRHPDFSPGDVVSSSSSWLWKLYTAVDMSSDDPNALLGQKLQKVDMSSGTYPPRLLSCYPLIGLTAILGVREKGRVTPGANQTLVVSGAAGACGSLAGQIGRLEGCARVVGICGSDEKCKFLVDELKFDAAINYKTQNVGDELKRTCPSGVDVYFDNVGGEISDSVIKQMNKDSHVILCGQIAVYNKDVPYPPPMSEEITTILQNNNITRDRFLVLHYPEKFPESMVQLVQWLSEGKLVMKETVFEGLENAGKAFVSMMNGGNIGKQIVHVSE